ncbi:MAG TPA: hypothetical protein VER04_11215, partial [Polyangiaceae bacterium]|nr:hypothetical protein [Polyangiaceae bacterium]
MKRLCWSFGFSVIACGGAQAAPPAEPAAAAPAAEAAPAASTPSAEAKSSAESAPLTVPTSCVKSGRFCLPDQKFSKRMCNSGSPSLALYLFGNGFGYTRGYLTRKTQAWNAAGGASDNSFLEFDEEVLLL